MFRRLAPYLVVFAGVGFFACLRYFAYLARISPPHPDPVTGHVAQMNDHGYYFYVYPWQGWVLNVGPFACVGAFFVIARIGQRQKWDLTTFTGPRWLKWVYFAAFGACLFYVFYRFP
jgi:hypothetical protein